MATSTTTAAILVLRNSAISSADMRTFASEIIRMAGSTERCILREGPSEGAVDAAAMTAVAA